MTALAVLAVLVFAPAEEAAEKTESTAVSAPSRRRAAPPDVFRDGLGAFYGNDHRRAAARMYDYVATNPDTAENRTWARYFLGVSLFRLGFTQAGAEQLFEVAFVGRQPEILPEALVEIERLMQGPHDESLLDLRLLVDGDFGYLPPDVAGFVRFFQGLADLRDGRRTWADRLFAAIPRKSPHAAQAAYAAAVDDLGRGKEAEAVRGFRAALAHPAAPTETRNQARLALARVLYEKKQYPAADAMYRAVEVPELTAAEGQLLLERAWTAYRQTNFPTAMGLLYALEAPSYRDLVAPEKFLLRALIYQRLCHYIPAKREIRRFRLHFGSTLEHIRRRDDLREDAVLRRAARAEDPRLDRLFAFRRALEAEAQRVDEFGGDFRETGLDEALREIHELAIQRTDRIIDARLTEAVRARAEELVAFEEQMYLLDYEVGLAIYRRLDERRARRGQSRIEDIPLAGPDAIYPFVGEFWNDELSRFDFLGENRCFDEEA